MTIKDDLEVALRATMKATAKTESEDARSAAQRKLLAIRGALGAITEAETAGKTRRELSAEDMVTVVKKEVAKREQSAQIYTDAGAPDRAEQELAEAVTLREFLPVETSETELAEAITEILGEPGQDYLGQGGRAIGVVLAKLKAQFENFDTRAATQIIRQNLGL